MLQLEFDKEHDNYLKAREKVVNKDSKGEQTLVLLDRYKLVISIGYFSCEL